MTTAFARALTRSRRALARDLPWIAHPDPWAILVAEVMLQQTSVARVREPWRVFLQAYPTPAALAAAPLDEVLIRWRGLGYPRRARNLREAARVICSEHAGAVPTGLRALRALPGVGEYTASAVASFAFGAPLSVLDTNVGRVLARALAAAPLTRLQARALADAARGRRASAPWNQAMIDLGAQFCTARPRCEVCPVRRACAWRARGGPDPAPASAGVSRAQAPFEGSDRQLRGRVLARLVEGVSGAAFEAAFADVERARLARILEGLRADGLVELESVRLARA